MRIAKNINVGSDKLSAGLSAALKICNELANSPDKSDIVDFSKTRFITPTFVLPFLIYVRNLDKEITFDNVTDYMEYIFFTSFGIDSGNMRNMEFTAFMKGYSAKTFIPLIRFPAANNRIDAKNEILSVVESIIIHQSGLKPNIVSGIKYMLGEIADNISEHSASESGYIMAQCYPRKRYVDVCIGDTGITLLGSYIGNPRYGVENDMDAMRAANNGISTKNLPEAENRGYGISTTKNMLINGLGGQYIMLSGSVVYINTPTNEGYLELPFGMSFKGTIVALRIPFGDDDFHYINYVE